MSDEQRKLPGAGLIQGLGVTLRSMTKRSVTQEYPHVRPELPPRSRGVIALLEENCTSCMLCARECPDWCIYIDSHKETIPATTEGGRDRTRNVLDRFAIDYSLCMYCGICIEVCPFDALFWSPEFEYAEGDILELTHEKDRLRDWMPSVPAPPADVPNAEPAKELGGGRPERRERPARPERPVREAAADATAPTVADDLPAESIAQVPPEAQQAAEADADAAPEAGQDSSSATSPDEDGGAAS